MACVCGHSIEEHEDGPCEGTNSVQDGKGRREEPCQCLGFEDDEEES